MDRYAEMWYNYEKDNYGGIVMFCSKCGNELSDGDAFCSKCGTAVQSSVKNAIHLVCQHCGSTMEFDEKHRIIVCPYCGSKELIEESDDVKIERIKSDTVITKEKLDYEREQFAEEVRQRENKDGLKMIVIGLAIMVAILIIVTIFVRFK